jgi:DNA-binding beta-propeller fold protein YncE
MTRFALVCFALATACGDNQDNSRPDASGMQDAAHPVPMAVVVSGDFDMTGIMSKLDITSLEVTPNVAPAGAVAGDPVVRHFGNRLYVVNRFGANNVTVLDASTFALVEQYSTGENSNPQDVAVVGNDLYVPALGTTGMVKITVTTGDSEVIDLGTALADPDGNPDCVSAYAVGSKVFVACGLREDFFPSGPGKVAVYDTASGEITAVTLPAENPQNYFVRTPESSMLGGDLLIPLVPSYNDYSTGCVARVSTGSTPTASCADGLSNMDLGGFQAHLDVAPDGTVLWIVVSTLDDNFENPTGSLRGFDLTTGTLWSAALSPTTQLINDVAACPDGSVVVVDRTMDAAGLRVYGSDTTERTSAAMAFGLPPSFGNNVVCYDVNAP